MFGAMENKASTFKVKQPNRSTFDSEQKIRFTINANRTGFENSSLLIEISRANIIRTYKPMVNTETRAHQLFFCSSAMGVDLIINSPKLSKKLNRPQ
jgi:hypothetical protein